MNESVRRSKRIFARTPGEQAFDRCLFPFAASFLVTIVLFIIGGIRHRSPSHTRSESALAVQLPDPVWLPWLYFALGLVLAGLWFRALLSLISAWRDPSATVLRFVSCVLLLPFAFMAFTFLSTPFR